jgi:predicted DCC family thiol-disulfide oxidoreductase YuxK
MHRVVLAARWLGQRWLNFWFEPSGPATLGFCRLLFFGGLFFLYLFEDFSAWGRVAPVFWKPIWLVGGWQLTVLDASVIAGLQVVWKTSLALAAVGLFTRAGMAVAFVAGAYLFTLSQNFGQVYHYEPFLILAMGGLALSRAADAWSLDTLAAAYRKPSHDGPAPSGEYTWPIRLVWVVVTLVFVGAGISKLRHAGPTWVMSDTMKTLLIRAYYNFSNTDPLVSWGLSLAEWPLAARAMAAAALLLELTFVLALVSRRARWILVPGAIGMVAGIRVLMGPTFGTFLLVNVVFWPPWSTVGRRLAALVPQKEAVTVFFDGACGICAGAMAVVRRLDLLRRVSMLDVVRDWPAIPTRVPMLTREMCLNEMHAVTASGAVVRGFHAYRALAWVVPLGWVLIPLLYVPGVNWLGERTYRAIAARRHRAACILPQGRA